MTPNCLAMMPRGPGNTLLCSARFPVALSSATVPVSATTIHRGPLAEPSCASSGTSSLTADQRPLHYTAAWLYTAAIITGETQQQTPRLIMAFQPQHSETVRLLKDHNKYCNMCYTVIVTLSNPTVSHMCVGHVLLVLFNILCITESAAGECRVAGCCIISTGTARDSSVSSGISKTCSGNTERTVGSTTAGTGWNSS